jgi:hypothetical protein
LPSAISFSRRRSFLFDAAQVGEDGQHFVEDGVGTAVESVGRFLGQITNPAAPRPMDSSTARLVDARQHEQQGRLTNAVWPHQPHLAIIGNAGCKAAKQVKVAKGLAQAMRVENCHRG